MVLKNAEVKLHFPFWLTSRCCFPSRPCVHRYFNPVSRIRTRSGGSSPAAVNPPTCTQHGLRCSNPLTVPARASENSWSFKINKNSIYGSVCSLRSWSSSVPGAPWMPSCSVSLRHIRGLRVWVSYAFVTLCLRHRAGETPDGAADPGGVQANSAGARLPSRKQDYPPRPEGGKHPAHAGRRRQARWVQMSAHESSDPKYITICIIKYGATGENILKFQCHYNYFLSIFFLTQNWPLK